MPPERVPHRQRLGVRDVEAGAPDQALVQRGHEVLAIDDLAPRDIDQDRVALHAAEEVAREEVVGRLRERQRDDHDVGGAEQVVEAVRLPQRHPGLGRDAVDVDREHLHAEAEGTPGDGAAGAAQADDAHGLLPQLALFPADRLAQTEVGLAQRGVHRRGDGRIDDLQAELSLARARRHRRPPRGLWTGAAYAATLKKISRAARRRWSMLARPVATSTYSMLSATSAEGTPRRARS